MTLTIESEEKEKRVLSVEERSLLGKPFYMSENRMSE